jgi:cytosol alanyl aminopeptidase
MRGSRRALALSGVTTVLALVWPVAAMASPSPEPPQLRLPATAAPTGYILDLTIDPGKDTFQGSVDMDVRVKEKTSVLWLNGTDLILGKLSASVDSRPVPVHAIAGGENFVGLAFDRPLAPGAVKLHVEYTGKLDQTSTQGLFRQKDGDDWYAFSQLESTDARRAFPCFDEPAYKVPWQLTLRIPAGNTAVSNTPIESESAAPDGTRIVRFKKTAPLPSYLVALAVGPFDYLDAGRAGAKKTPIRIVTPRGKASQGRYAAQTTGPLLERLEAYFGIPYPYEKLDQLAIPQTVTFAAMENAGLITWSERALIAPPGEETVTFQRYQASVNAHEMAHQWFGDLVTLAWWDDVWLNESFATWMADRTIIEWKPEWAEDVNRVVASSNVMFGDTLVSARKIRQEIVSNDDIVNAFDGISYQKGAAVLTMFEAWVGAAKFQAGVHDYLEAHRFGNATVTDFLGALEKASQPGVAAAFSTFLDQPGVPVVDVSLDCAGGQGKVALSQRRLLPLGSVGATAESWRIPVCMRAGSDGKSDRACTLLTEASGSARSPSAGCPAWLAGNDAELGYYRTLYRGDLLQKLLAVADRQLSIAERVGLIRDVNALAEAGALPMADALALVPRFSGDPSRQIVAATLRIAADVNEHLVSQDMESNYRRFISKMYGPRARALGFVERPGDSDETKLLRHDLVAFVAREGQEPDLQAEARRLALKWLDDRASVSPDLVGQILDIAARHGDRTLFERFLEAAKASPNRRDRRRLYGALGEFQDAGLLKQALALTLDPALDFRETEVAMNSATETPLGRAAVWEFVQAHFDAIVARMPRETTAGIVTVGDGFCDTASEKDVKAFYESRVEKLPGGPRNLAQTLESIQLCIASKAAQEPGVREFLKGY